MAREAKSAFGGQTEASAAGRTIRWWHPQLFGALRSWDGAAWHDPSHWLFGDCGDEVVVAVIVQERDLLSFSHGGDQQIGKADCPHMPGAPQHALHLKGAVPVLVVGGQPFVAFFSVGSDLVELGTVARRPAELRFDDTARRYQAGLNQRG
jgi:hypothetical protein